MKISYRPDIDGLRAISIIGVILYHAQINFYNYNIFKGGFLGVDIFFVVSGYLITSIILKELEKKQFEFLYFYERRIRRIIPAFIFLILFILPASFFILMPTQFLELSYSILSSIFFNSNIYFWYTNNLYGAQETFLLPFLHSWSLSIEEQFYLIFPLLLFLIWKYKKKKLLNILLLLLFISFFFSVYELHNKNNFSFYMLHTRSWELLLGSVLACIPKKKLNLFSSKVWGGASYLGIILIIMSFILFKNENDHPSYWTLLPILGTCLIICCPSNLNFLSNKLMVWIGSISYSLYLWHYPIFTLSKITNFTNGELIKKIFILFMVFFMSIVSYYLIEKPFRENNFKFRNILKIISIFYLILIFLLLFVIRFEGFPKRTEITKNYNLDKRYYLLNDHYSFRVNYIPNNFLENNYQKNVLFIGNSFGEDLFKSFYLNKEKFKNYNFDLISPKIRTKSIRYDIKCLDQFLTQKKTLCENFDYTDSIYEQFNKSDIIILSSFWDETDITKLNKIIDLLYENKKTIIIVGQSIILKTKTSYNFNPLDYFVYLNKRLPNKYELMAIEKAVYSDQDQSINRELSSIAKQRNITFLNPIEYQCDLENKTCKLLLDDNYKIYFDYGHLTKEGAKYFGNKILEKNWFNFK